MANKPAISIENQIALLKDRGMIFRDESLAKHFLNNISYYRLKGYWWDMQEDKLLHTFQANTYFEETINRYNFDRHLRLILFDAIERIEIALRTKMIYHMSMKYGGIWYLESSLFQEKIIMNNGIQKTIHLHTIDELKKEFTRSQEIFIKDHRNRFPLEEADAWKILEVASFGTLSKLYKNLNHQLPEKSIIAKEMGLNLHSELSSWLEAITYVRNIIAHHSRMWSRSMVKTPIEKIKNPLGNWFSTPLSPSQIKKPFLIISCLVYICDFITPGHHIKLKILDLIDKSPTIPVHKMGFVNNWNQEPIWKQEI